MDPTWLAAIMNGGALMILAYHFLVGLPAILDRISKDSQLERNFWADQACEDRADFSRRAELVAVELRALTAKLVAGKSDQTKST